MRACLQDELEESSPIINAGPRKSGGTRVSGGRGSSSGGGTYSHLRPPSLQLQPAQLVPRSVSSTHPSRFSDALGTTVGTLPSGGSASRSRSGGVYGGRAPAASSGPTSLRSDYTDAFSHDGVGGFGGDGGGGEDEEEDDDSRRLDDMSDAITHLFMAGLRTGSSGSRTVSQAECLIQDLTELRLLGRGGCGNVYKVGPIRGR